MKNIIITFFIFTSLGAYTQNETSPWFFGVGVNAVDYKTHVKSDINLDRSAVRLSAGRYLFSNISVEASYALNTIDNFSDATNFDREHAALDLTLSYSFRSFLYRKNGLLDPYLGAGVGITWLENLDRTGNAQSATVNAVVGINFWINQNWIIYSQAAYKNSGHDYLDSYIEYAIGIKYVFSFERDETCFP